MVAIKATLPYLFGGICANDEDDYQPDWNDYTDCAAGVCE